MLRGGARAASALRFRPQWNERSILAPGSGAINGYWRADAQRRPAPIAPTPTVPGGAAGGSGPPQSSVGGHVLPFTGGGGAK